MRVVIVAALSRNRVIGREGGIPWHYPADLRHLRRTTWGHPVVMGRKTFESLASRPLTGRSNIVLTRQEEYPAPPGVVVCRSLLEAIRWAEEQGAERLSVLGGAEVYRQALPLSDEMVITYIPAEVEGDTCFPEWNEDEWEVVDSRSEGGLRFATYARRAAPG